MGLIKQDNLDVPNIIKRAADNNGFSRVRYTENKIPTSISEVVAMPFFGDMRSTFVLSSIILPRIKNELRGSKYFILCSWPGCEGLFPYVDEYWEIKDVGGMSRMWWDTDDFENNSAESVVYNRGLNHFFEEVYKLSEFNKYYNRGFEKEFFDRFSHVKRFLPSVPSGAVLGSGISKKIGSFGGYKVFLQPTKKIRVWANGRQVLENSSKDFWKRLCERLLEERYLPVIWQSSITHDLSPDFGDSCVFINDSNVTSILGIMRLCGCVLDMYNGLSRYAIAARCPFVCFDERQRYNAYKEYEIDDICGLKVPREYIYSFPTIITLKNDADWDTNYLDVLTARLNDFLPDLNRDNWPSTSEVNDIVPYDRVRKKKVKKFGTRFIKIPNE